MMSERVPAAPHDARRDALRVAAVRGLPAATVATPPAAPVGAHLLSQLAQSVVHLQHATGPRLHQCLLSVDLAHKVRVGYNNT